MNLKDFIINYVETDTVIRLWYKVKGGYQEVLKSGSPYMEHELINSIYANNKVIGVTDIVYFEDAHNEAVNIVVEN